MTRQPNWSKLDSGMLSFLSEISDGEETHDPDARDVSLFIETKPNLSQYALRTLKKLRFYHSRTDQTIFTAELSINEIIQLSHRRFVVRLTKSRQLHPC